jgi:hypothetical protein
MATERIRIDKTDRNSTVVPTSQPQRQTGEEKKMVQSENHCQKGAVFLELFV